MYIYIYTRGLGTRTASQHNLFDWEKLRFSCTRTTTQQYNTLRHSRTVAFFERIIFFFLAAFAGV